MRHKRLRHISDTLCHMFCGWETFFDYNTLVDLGNGKLTIDILDGKCKFNAFPIEQLNIAKALFDWFREECIANNIELVNVLEAKLFVDLNLSIINWNERKYSLEEIFYHDGRQIKTDKMYQCTFSCESIISTDEKKYGSAYCRTREWPLRWPSTE